MVLYADELCMPACACTNEHADELRGALSYAVLAAQVHATARKT